MIISHSHSLSPKIRQSPTTALPASTPYPSTRVAYNPVAPGAQPLLARPLQARGAPNALRKPPPQPKPPHNPPASLGPWVRNPPPVIGAPFRGGDPDPVGTSHFPGPAISLLPSLLPPRPPQIPRCHATMRPPALADLNHFFLRGQFAQSIRHAHGVLHAQVVHGEDVRVAQGE